MIVPMKKVSLVVTERDHVASLRKLREVGVMHLQKKDVSSDTLIQLLEKRASLRRAAGLVRRYPVPKSGPPRVAGSPATRDLIRQILDLGDEKKTLLETLVRETKERHRVEGWGDFAPLDFELFAMVQGLLLTPYELPIKVFESLDDNVKFLVLSRDKRLVRVLIIGEEMPGGVPFVLPERSLSQMDASIANIRKRLEKIEVELANLALHRGNIEAEITKLQGEIEFETARAGMETLAEAPPETTVSWLSGFVPLSSLGSLKRAAAENSWALVIDDPSDDDKPPTLVRNKPAVRIIQPLFSFLGTVPGYREYDISQSYLIFFCLFFAMIFGDAAYGVLLFSISLAAGLAFRKKGGGAKFPDAAKFFMLLSFCTVVWGSITGSWFALPAEKLPPFLKALIVAPFNDSGPLAEFPPFLRDLFKLPAEVPVDDLKTRWNIQFLCFTVGAAQLIWARSKNIRKLLPSLTALAQAGWLVMMLGLYFLVLFMLLKLELPSFATWLIGIGLGVYFIFAEQNGGNFFKNILKSFSNILSIFLNAVGSFADIISYIRLFAVGLAGSIIAESFNAMAGIEEGLGGMNFGVALILKILAAVLILVFGHSLNIVMNALSVVVHGVRLNLLEYAGNHLGMEWSGYAYNPFAERQKKH